MSTDGPAVSSVGYGVPSHASSGSPETRSTYGRLGHSGMKTKSSPKHTIKSIERSDVSNSESIVQDPKMKWGQGIRWIPLIRLLSIIEQHGILFWGTPRQPFDPRELVWTSAIGIGAEAVAKLITTLDMKGVNKRWFTSTVPKHTSSVSYFGAYPRAIYQELAVLAHASLSNINTVIKLIAVDKNYSINYFSIVIEFAEFHTLREYLERHNPIDERQAKLFCSQVTAALEYLHSQEILHNDVKLENILITRDGAKLSDFGHSIFNFKTQTKHRLKEEGRLVGTKRWTAPELHDLYCLEELNPLMSATSDIYSLGFVIAFLAAGFDFFLDVSTRTLNDWKCNNQVINRLPPNIIADSAWASRILRKTLCLQPSQRFQSASEILSNVS